MKVVWDYVAIYVAIIGIGCFIFGAMIGESLTQVDSEGVISPKKAVLPQIDGCGAGIRTVEAIITAYCPKKCCCGKWADGYTASGHKIRQEDRFVAMEGIPFGTNIVIAGYNGGEPVPCLDRGGAIKGNRIDVFFNEHQEALNWGVRKMKVGIIKEMQK